MTPVVVAWVMAAVAIAGLCSLWLGDRERRPGSMRSTEERVAALATYIARLRLQRYARDREQRFRRYDATWSSGTSTPRHGRPWRVVLRPHGPWLN